MRAMIKDGFNPPHCPHWPTSLDLLFWWDFDSSSQSRFVFSVHIEDSGPTCCKRITIISSIVFNHDFNIRQLTKVQEMIKWREACDTPPPWNARFSKVVKCLNFLLIGVNPFQVYQSTGEIKWLEVAQKQQSYLNGQAVETPPLSSLVLLSCWLYVSRLYQVVVPYWLAMLLVCCVTHQAAWFIVLRA